MNMDPSVSTIERDHINILVWPVFGGMYGWAALAPGVFIQIRANDEESFRTRSDEGIDALWDLIDKEHEKDAEHLHNFIVCWPHKGKPIKLVPVPAAPPYLNENIIQRCMDQAYSDE